jgi:hypothetical protein
MKCFSIKDIKSEGFNTPFFQATYGLAERSFKDACQDVNSSLNKHPDDFSLYYIGEFNMQTGKFEPELDPKFICKAEVNQ